MTAETRRKTARETGNARRTRQIAEGLCGFCGKPRNKLKFLCDDCAKNHRERQARKKAARQQQRQLDSERLQDQPEREKMALTFSIIWNPIAPAHQRYSVVRKVEGAGPVVISKHATEQAAERALAEMRGAGPP